MKYIILIVALAMLSVTACSDDTTGPPPQNQATTGYHDLSQRWHAIHNMEMAWNDRSVTRYDQALDANFKFYFSLGDIGNNGIPESWDRPTEMVAVGNMFDPSYVGALRITDISFDVDFDPTDPNGTISWTEVSPGPGPFDGETWYQTILNYDYTIKADPDLTFITQGNMKAQYTLRKDPTDNKWRIVEIRDLGSS